FEAGADVVRINFSHGTAAERAHLVELVRETSRKCGRYVGILGDLQGPKIRICRFQNGGVELREGQQFVLDSAMNPEAGTEEG
ncbi:MAG: pyruvate kinase, partial [Gammaproteobacteria bacterium]|nr:pyruvate kinase [Gammaproteobacteria bacterium]